MNHEGQILIQLLSVNQSSCPPLILNMTSAKLT